MGGIPMHAMHPAMVKVGRISKMEVIVFVDGISIGDVIVDVEMVVEEVANDTIFFHHT